MVLEILDILKTILMKLVTMYQQELKIGVIKYLKIILVGGKLMKDLMVNLFLILIIQ